MANRGLGTTFTKGVQLIGSLTEISGIDASSDTLDVTTLDSSGGYKSYINGFKDAGEVGIKGFFVSSDAGQIDLITDFNSGDEDTFIITLPTGVTWTFQGIVTKIMTGVTVEDPITFEATIKVVGAPVLGTVASTGISALEITKAGGAALTAAAWTPTFAIGVLRYVFTYTTETGFVVKATAGSHVIKLYVDDVLVETLTSGTESAAIAQASVGCKEVKIMVYEVGKTPKVYVVMTNKTS